MKHGIGRKLLSVVLAVMMLVSLLPTAAFADEISSYSTEPTTVNENVKPADSEKSSEDANVGNGGNDVGNNADANTVNNSSDDEADKGENKVALQAVAETAVARIGEKSYATLKEAINAATTGDTITLLQDVNLGSSNQTLYSTGSGKTNVNRLTFDLNGNTITSSNTTNTVTASRDGLVIKNGTIENTAATTSKGAIYATFSTAGTHSLTLENVTVIAQDTGIYATTGNGNATVTIGNKTTINAKMGIKVVGPENNNNKTYAGSLALNVSGGTVTGAECGIHVKGPAKKNATAAVTVNVTGGEVSSITTNSTNSYLPTNVNISGGTVTGELKNAADDKITISGGIFEGDVRNLSSGTIAITGGKFTTADVSSYVPTGYEYDSATGEVKQAAEPTGVAKIGKRGYATLPEAVKAASAGETIVLLDNITLSSVQTISKQLTIDLNGKIISSTAYRTIQLNTGADLTVKDSGTGGKIDGQNKNCGFDVSGGTLTLDSGSIVNCTDADGDGGAVDVSSQGKFTMNGGAISNCKAGDDGGAIDIGKGCTFTMNGGTDERRYYRKLFCRLRRSGEYIQRRQFRHDWWYN